MSILETFFILFKTDADKAADDVERLGKAGDKAERSLLNTDAAVGRLGGSFVSMAAQLAAPILALASLGGIMSTVFERVRAIDDIADAAGKLRSSAADYEAFTRAVRASGGTLQDAQANLANFSDKLNDAAARPDGPNAKNFAKWGIIFKDVNGEAVGAVDGVLALAKSLEGVSQAEALGRLRRLGIQDADTISFLLQGKQAIIEKMEAEKRAGVVTENQIRIVGDYQSAIGRSSNLLDTFANELTEALLPALTKGVEVFNRFFGWMLDHEALVKGFFIGVAGVITAVFLPAMASAAAATIAATWPFLAIAAAVIGFGAAVALVYEDLTAYFNGQNSLIGELIKKYQWLIDAVKDAWNKIAGAVLSAWSIIQPVLQAIADGATSIIDGYIKLYTPIYEAFKNVFSAVGELASAFKDRITNDIAALLPGWISNFQSMKSEVADAFADMLTRIQPFVDGVKVAAQIIEDLFRTLGSILKEIWGATIGWMAEKLNGIADAIRGLAGGVRIPVTIENVGQAGSTIGGMVNMNRATNGVPPGLSPQTSNTIGAPSNDNSKSTTVNVGGVTQNIKTNDPKALADSFNRYLDGQLRSTASQFDDGVDR